MSLTFVYQMSGCVLIVPQYVPGIVAHLEVGTAAGGKRTQYFDTPEIELAVYGTLQVSSTKAAPPQQANLSIAQGGNETVARLVTVSQAAFSLALKEQNAIAMGINLNATIAIADRDATTLLSGLLNPIIASRNTGNKVTMIGGGIR